MIFEEAAGITKYKNQKATALRKLVETENNLLRVQDILEELKNQAEPLAVQAEAARLYLQVSEELAALEINHSAQELARIRRELEDLSGQEMETTGSMSSLDQEERALEERIAGLKSALAQLENEKSNTQDLLGAWRRKGTGHG